jgi:DNA-binding MarR family transcriptional regulator
VIRDESPQLSELLMHAARLQRRRWRDVLAPWGLSPSQARALRIVCERDSTRVSDLAEALRIAPRSATEVADDLEARGLVQRAPDPSDRRAVLLQVTAQGRAVRDEVDAARAADSHVLFAKLTADERTRLAELLRKVAEET